MRVGALILLWLPLWGQSMVARHPAGSDAEGNQLSIVEARFPERQPNDDHCVPKVKYVLEKSRSGQVISSDTVLVLCQTSSQAEVNVTVGPNSITVSRRVGAHRGYYINQTYQLSPWRTSAADGCNFEGSSWVVVERWDYRKLRFLVREGSGEGPREPHGGTCDGDSDPHSYLIVPSVTADAQRLEGSRAHLGNCALSLDASDRNGYVIWGKRDPTDPLEVKLVRIGPHTLFVQVVDPQHRATPGSSWWNADHIEIWMGERSDARSGWKFGIPLEEGPAQVGWGNPTKLPEVRRWAANLGNGRKAILLRIELPAPVRQYDNNMALTVAYSQTLEGRASRRMVASSPVKRGDWNSLGVDRSDLGDNSSEDNVTCEIVQGSLEISGGPKIPVESPRPWRRN